MRIKTLALLAAVSVVAGIAAIANDALAKYEEPTYSILEKDGSFEIRDYPSVIAAEVEVPGSGESAASQAFRIIAGYIFGKNVSKKKIAMTVPVTTDKKQDHLTMRFYLPSSYTLETLPEPIDRRIKLSIPPAARYAVIRFSGFSSESNCAQQEELLKDFLKRKNLDPIETPIRAFYNPPWTLPFMRRNEIWQKVRA
jgi:effector-binding domain-containing protein